MFFYLSKILDFLISPITWIVILLAIAVFTKNEVRKRKTLIASFVCLLVFSNPLLLSLAGNFIPSCKHVVTDKEKQRFDVGIIMGGMISYDEARSQLLFNGNVNRMTQTVELYKKGIIKHIFITGGSGSILYPKKREASLLKNYIVTYYHIPSMDIQIENKSNNTHENALFSKPILDSLHWTNKRLVMVTSPLHQYRAQACFAKQGVKTYIYTRIAQKNTWEKVLPRNVFLPQAEVLLNWNNFLHELIGIATYKLAGYL
jgi:uncharacterized SAM-binding protein YcdF (DUF218 family)